MKEKLISKLLIATGIVFVVYGVVLCIKSNLNVGVVLVAVIGIFLLAFGICYKKLKKITEKGFFKFCKTAFILAVSLEILLTAFIAVYGLRDNVDYSEDAVIVLGAGIHGDKVTYPLKLRLDKAVAYHEKNSEAVIVVTGGMGFQETVTEAYAMEKYLVEKGVNKNKIIKEEKATSTAENMRFSKEILDNLFDKDYSVVVITNNFHVFRGTAIAQKTGFDNVSHMHAGLQWYNLIPCYLRENLAVLRMFLPY